MWLIYAGILFFAVRLGVQARRKPARQRRLVATRRGEGGQRIHVVAPMHDLAIFNGYH
jgi:hypothetical protein